MTTLLIVLLSLLPQSAEPWKHQLDLEPMLRDSESLKRLTIMYDSPLQQGFELLFVREDGSLILQRYPGRPMATTDLPTCAEEISQDQVTKLAGLTGSKHFWELPEKRFLFIGGEPSHKELEVHRSSSATELRRRGVFLLLGPMLASKKRFPMTLQ
jgi:hypothetical protein